MNQTTAVVILAISMFIYLSYAAYLGTETRTSCYAVADTPAKLAICKGVSYKEQPWAQTLFY